MLILKRNKKTPFISKIWKIYDNARSIADNYWQFQTNKKNIFRNKLMYFQYFSHYIEYYIKQLLSLCLHFSIGLLTTSLVGVYTYQLAC